MVIRATLSSSRFQSKSSTIPSQLFYGQAQGIEPTTSGRQSAAVKQGANEGSQFLFNWSLISFFGQISVNYSLFGHSQLKANFG